MILFFCLVGKIVEFAPRWLNSTCENVDDDWNEDEQEMSMNLTKDNPVMISDELSSAIQTAMGISIDATHTQHILLTGNTTMIQKHNLGYLSRFLLLALNQLEKKHKLCRTTIDRIYVTKHELNTVNNKSIFIRKVYITPSTILYEGPYREETCLVTRHFKNEQQGFVRICFRDESKLKEIFLIT